MNAGLILTSLIGYLEWGGNNAAFLFSAEAEIISKLIRHPSEVLHPFTVLPLLGQMLLIITLFQSTPGKKLTYTAIAFIGILMIFILFIGMIGMNLKVAASVIPFIVLSVFTIRQYREAKVNL